MSRRSMKKGAGEVERPAGIYMVGPVAFADVSGDLPYRPPADVSETSEGLIIRMELPGLQAEDIRVVVQGATIEVSGEKRRDPHCSDASFICLERSFGRFCREFELSGCLNMAGVSASLKGGVLVLLVPKCEERRGRARRIPIAIEPDRKQ